MNKRFECDLKQATNKETYSTTKNVLNLVRTTEAIVYGKRSFTCSLMIVEFQIGMASATRNATEDEIGTIFEEMKLYE